MNELKNYIDYHKLSKTGKISDWLERISAQFYLSSATENQQNPSTIQKDKEADSTELMPKLQKMRNIWVLMIALMMKF